MINNSKDKQRSRLANSGSRAIAIVLALLTVLVFAQMISAAQDDAQPTAPAEQAAPSPFTGQAPTFEQILAMPPGTERYVAGHSLPEGVIAKANLESSTAVASAERVPPNGVFAYAVDVTNTGGFDIPAKMTNALPAQASFVNVECDAVTTYVCDYSDGTVTWHGVVLSGDSATIKIVARLNGDAVTDTTVKSAIKIASAEQNIDRSVEVAVGPQAASLVQYVPITTLIAADPGPVTLAAGLPNSNNTWTLSWTSSLGATGYEIHESQDSGFATVTPYVVGPSSSLSITKPLTPDNVYYYRVRSFVGQKFGPWSNVGTVIGGYLDEFDDPDTGWSLRRSTFREEVFGFYEDGKYVMQVLDRWDWGLASPLRPAPRVPYVIDFEMRIVAPANLLSGGMVFGGDWNGETCPPGLSYDEWYKHKNCFNHFYNTNTIFFGGLKMLFERVDELVWCQNCDGSPMKRLGHLDPGDNEFTLDEIDPEGWNHYRVEVRQDNIKVYAAKRGSTPKLQFTYDDTRWANEPYFGFFASTDEYNNSTWRFEYMEVKPLD